jgi:N-acetylglutamate synthase-like GNAT family acetyltransferase
LKITKASKEEMEFIDDMLLEFNNKKVPFSQSQAFIDINRCIKNEKDEIIAGISATLEMWNILHINILWVSDKNRGNGLGKALIKDVEGVAKEHDSKMSYLETFGFQAKDFYENHGYTVFGELENCVEDHSLFFMQKKL